MQPKPEKKKKKKPTSHKGYKQSTERTKKPEEN